LKKTKFWVMTASILLLSIFLLGAQCQQKLETQEQTEEEGTEDLGDEGGNLEGGATGNQEDTEEPFVLINSTGNYEGACGEDSCGPDEVCYQGRCKVPECATDADCVDDDGCTPDKCEFAGHPNAFCSTDIITLPRNNDGCCPVEAYLDVDTDCVPVCGNHKCEVGETKESCEEDCKNAGGGGTTQASPTYGGPE